MSTRATSACRSGLLVLAVGLGVSGIYSACAAAAAIAVPAVLSFAKNLLSTASENYAPDYAKDIEKLLAAIATPAGGAAVAAQPAAANKTASETGSQAAAPAIQLDVAVLRQQLVDGRQIAVPIADGGELRDGRGDPDAGDKLKITLRANQPCHVYAIAVDGTGWVVPVFPSALSSRGNPVEINRTYVVPEATEWFGLDEHRGIENIYFVASRQPRPDIAALMATFAGRVRPDKPAFRQVSQPAVTTRGLVAPKPGAKTAVQTESGERQDVTPMSFLSDIAGVDVVVTRWFHHR